jgi:hypothetical protein
MASAISEMVSSCKEADEDTVSYSSEGSKHKQLESVVNVPPEPAAKKWPAGRTTPESQVAGLIRGEADSKSLRGTGQMWRQWRVATHGRTWRREEGRGE